MTSDPHATRPPSPRQTSRALACFVALLVTLIGCAAKPRQPQVASSGFPGLERGVYFDDLDATLLVPAGWKIDRDERASGHRQRVWVSPSGLTALGVIRFTLPLPVGHSGVIWGFLTEMKKSEGAATLLDKRWDESMNAMRFTAQGGRYTVDAILRVRGFSGLLVYAGTLTNQPIDQPEVELAQAARDRATWGK